MDPLANIRATIRYCVKRYGSVAAGLRGVNYNRPEPVLTVEQWRLVQGSPELFPRPE